MDKVMKLQLLNISGSLAFGAFVGYQAFLDDGLAAAVICGLSAAFIPFTLITFKLAEKR